MTDRQRPDPRAAAGGILVAGARGLAHGDGLRPTLQALIDSIAEQVGVQSAAIVVPGPLGRLDIVASFGLGEQAVAGLTAAIANPAHPIARTMATPATAFDVPPTVPGGPTLRSHVPLVVTRAGTDSVLGVLALAHDDPIDEWMRPFVQAAADLAASAIERHLRG